MNLRRVILNQPLISLVSLLNMSGETYYQKYRAISQNDTPMSSFSPPLSLAYFGPWHQDTEQFPSHHSASPVATWDGKEILYVMISVRSWLGQVGATITFGPRATFTPDYPSLSYIPPVGVTKKCTWPPHICMCSFFLWSMQIRSRL